MSVELNLFVMYLCNVSVWSCDIHDAFGLEESIGGLRRDKVSIGGASASYSEAGEKRERLRRPRWVGEMDAWMHGRSE